MVVEKMQLSVENSANRLREKENFHDFNSSKRQKYCLVLLLKYEVLDPSHNVNG